VVSAGGDRRPAVNENCTLYDDGTAFCVRVASVTLSDQTLLQTMSASGAVMSVVIPEQTTSGPASTSTSSDLGEGSGDNGAVGKLPLRRTLLVIAGIALGAALV
jgi:hypothetical protein